MAKTEAIGITNVENSGIACEYEAESGEILWLPKSVPKLYQCVKVTLPLPPCGFSSGKACQTSLSPSSCAKAITDNSEGEPMQLTGTLISVF